MYTDLGQPRSVTRPKRGLVNIFMHIIQTNAVSSSIIQSAPGCSSEAVINQTLRYYILDAQIRSKLIFICEWLVWILDIASTVSEVY